MAAFPHLEGKLSAPRNALDGQGPITVRPRFPRNSVWGWMAIRDPAWAENDQTPEVSSRL
jgi:hypothetical protein